MFYQPRWRSRQRHLCLSECLLTSSFDIFYIIILYTAMSNKGICLSVIREVKSQGVPRQTTRTLTGFTHHYCGARLINRCIVRWPGPHPSGNQQCPLDAWMWFMPFVYPKIGQLNHVEPAR